MLDSSSESVFPGVKTLQVEALEAGWCRKLGVQSSEDAFNALLQQPLPGSSSDGHDMEMLSI